MSIVSTANMTPEALAIVSECGGSTVQTADLMIGIGLIKDSEAVYFQYLGDDNQAALIQPSGKPVDRIGNVRLTGLSIADDVYAEAGFKGSKLNVMLETQQGRSVMLTSGLTTIWSQCLLTSLMGAMGTDALDHLLSVNTWKGNSKMKPCFAAVRDGQRKMTSNVMYQALADSRADRDRAKTEALLRDAVELINAAVTGGEVQDVQVTDLDNAVAEF